MQAFNRLAPLALILALSVPATAQEAIRWQTNLDQAKTIAAQTNRLVLVHFWAEWCAPCKQLEGTVFNQPAVGAALEASYVPVKLNLDRNRLLAQKYNVRKIPTDVVITPSDQVVASFTCPQNSQAYIAQVSQIAQRGMNPSAAQLAQAGAGAVSAGSSPYAGIGQRPSVPVNGPLQQPTTTAQAPTGGRYAPASYGQPSSPPTQNQYAPQQNTSQGYRPAAPSNDRYAQAAQPRTSTYGSIPNHAAQNRYSQDRYGAVQAPVQNPTGVNGAAQTPSYNNGNRYGSAPQQPTYQPQGSYRQQPAPYGQQAAPQQTVNPYANPGVSAAQPRPQYQPAQQPPVQQQRPVQQQPAVQQNPYVQQPQQPQPTAAAKPSPYALDGFCPVELMNAQRWAAGDKQFGAVHRGQTFLFTSAANQQKFLANPDRFAPALGGIDPILALENQQTVTGKRRHGVYYRDRIYLFSNEASLARFNQNPGHYAEGVRQALLRQNAASQRR